LFQPAHIDGRTLIILRRGRSSFGSAFAQAMSGRLEHDGEKLTLVGDCHRRVITEAKLASLMPVNDGNRIPQCHGFDLFMIEEPEET
jgi:hypothetical protein